MSRKSREGHGQIQVRYKALKLLCILVILVGDSWQYLTSQINGDISCVLKLLDNKALEDLF